MRWTIASDLHTEFIPGGGDKLLTKDLPDADGVIIAGDLTTPTFLKANIKWLCHRYKHVVYVSGNHEYYGSSFLSVDFDLLDMKKNYKNFHWLNNETVEIDGQRFVGSTLWFARTQEAMSQEIYLSDFSRIIDSPSIYDRHDDAVVFLKSTIQRGDVVVTHHAPSYLSVGDRFKNSTLNCFFANHLDQLILDTEPKLWVHGHMHGSKDYTIGSTRIYCNPYGYRNYDENPDFKYETVEI